jgi:hypothetical protein
MMLRTVTVRLLDASRLVNFVRSTSHVTGREVKPHAENALEEILMSC